MTDGEFKAKLVALYDENRSTCKLKSRQLPLIVDDTLTMVINFESVSSTSCSSFKPNEVNQFTKKYRMFSHDELPEVLQTDESVLSKLMSTVVPCVGCRKSVERLYDQLTGSKYPSLDPFFVNDDGYVSVSKRFMYNSKLLCSVFSRYGSKLNSYIDSIPRTKKNRRCLIHSLDSQKVRPAGVWLDVWEHMSFECREEVVIIEQDYLYNTLETYLRKHRFCGECKSKVLQAYNLLVHQADPSKEKGFQPSLYEGINYCAIEKHVHVKCDTDFVAILMSKAEPELRGGRREKHAKTIDVAQEEVLICLGVCLYERLHRISQRLKEEEQTWKILFYLCAECLKMNFELNVESKLGVSQLELVCKEIQRKELAEQQKREHKRQKRREKKHKLKIELVESSNAHLENYEILSNEDKDLDSNSNPLPKMKYGSSGLLFYLHPPGEASDEPRFIDRGYRSGSIMNSPYSSSPSSCDGTYAESCSSHDDECPSCTIQWNKMFYSSNLNPRVPLVGEIVKITPQSLFSNNYEVPGLPLFPSLQDLLKKFNPSDEDAYINPDELMEMEAKMRLASKERLKFRENLKIRFQDFQKLSKFRFKPFVLRTLSNHCLDL